MDLQPFLDHLETQGYAVLPGFLDRATTAAVREHIDRLAPPIEPADLPGRKRVHDLRHPIPGQIMARLIATPGLIDVALAILHSHQRSDLRMLEQVLLRSDPEPRVPSGAGAGTAAGPQPTGWHIDMAFLPEHYSSAQSRPRQTYFHMVHCCNTIKPGAAAFMIVPGSHRLTYAATAKLEPSQLDAFKANVAQAAGIDPSKGVEVCAQEGDLLVFNPMCLHSASRNFSSSPRYVYFISFMDKSAAYLSGELKRTNYLRPIPDDLRLNTPAELQTLFE